MDSTDFIEANREERQGDSMKVRGREDEKQRRVLSGTPGRRGQLGLGHGLG